MAVIAYIEHQNKIIKKSGIEVSSFAAKVAQQLSTNVIAVVIGAVENIDIISSYGITNIIHINGDTAIPFDSQQYTKILADVVQEQNANLLIIPHSANGKSLLGRLAIRLNASSVSGVNSLPNTTGEFIASKSVFSGKAIVNYKLTKEKKVISLMGNAVQPEMAKVAVEVTKINIPMDSTKLRVIESKTIQGTVPLPEAEIVVSAGRGMKGPENWGIIEDLAKVLGATTACSRPVADTGWRPHHEHVGQTGVAIRPNLYIAAGISGAIQHLAGVNNSKVIVVINKDAEAPFFKAADYGVVGDLFDIVPKLTDAIKKFKNA